MQQDIGPVTVNQHKLLHLAKYRQIAADVVAKTA
jgi:hypothetical protein